MIIGIGSDLIDIRRIEKTLERFGERFINRVFTPVEIARSERKAQRIPSYAKRFAAKEACSKALGTGFRAGVFMKDLGVVNLPSGKPTMAMTGPVFLVTTAECFWEKDRPLQSRDASIHSGESSGAGRGPPSEPSALILGSVGAGLSVWRAETLISFTLVWRRFVGLRRSWWMTWGTKFSPVRRMQVISSDSRWCFIRHFKH